MLSFITTTTTTYVHVHMYGYSGAANQHLCVVCSVVFPTCLPACVGKTFNRSKPCHCSIQSPVWSEYSITANRVMLLGSTFAVEPAQPIYDIPEQGFINFEGGGRAQGLALGTYVRIVYFSEFDASTRHSARSQERERHEENSQKTASFKLFHALKRLSDIIYFKTKVHCTCHVRSDFYILATNRIWECFEYSPY